MMQDMHGQFADAPGMSATQLAWMLHMTHAEGFGISYTGGVCHGWHTHNACYRAAHNHAGSADGLRGTAMAEC